MNTATARTMGAIVFGWLAIFTCINLFRPLMPVDETRYMTVAWEMLLRDTWLLPTLNFEAYSHKPPLLFWLIRGSWEVFGVSVMPVRAVLSVFILALFALTARLAKTILPDIEALPQRSMLMLGALPLFLIYASMIMFDSLLTVSVLCGILCIWHAAQTGAIKPWLWLGVALGMGILTKGPVALVYILPSALLAPLWAAPLPVSRKRWYGYIGLAVLIGACFGLAWAIPAAIEGGQAYAQKIFVTQSAGRMVNAFDHQEPAWFYLPVLLSFLAPFFVWPAFWGNIKTRARDLFKGDDTRRAVRFLLCVAVPVFCFFTTIASKQIHYMIPILPAVSILAALAITRAGRDMPAGLPITLSALPSLILLCDYVSEKITGAEIAHWDHIMDGFMPWVAALHIAIAVALGWWCETRPAWSVRGMAAAAFTLVVFSHLQLATGFFPRFDFAPLARAYEPYRDRPLAVVPKYDGEYGFALRLTKPMLALEGTTIDPWLDANRDGIVVMRDNFDENFDLHYTFYHTQLFRLNKRIALIGYKEKKK